MSTKHLDGMGHCSDLGLLYNSVGCWQVGHSLQNALDFVDISTCWGKILGIFVRISHTLHRRAHYGEFRVDVVSPLDMVA